MTFKSMRAHFATWYLGLALAAFSSASFAATALAPEESRYLETGEATRRVAEPYFAAYLARDWDRLEALFHEQGSWSDPTAEQLFGGTRRDGKIESLKYLRQAFAGIEHMDARVSRRLFSADIAVFESSLDWTLVLRNGKRIQTLAMPFVVILKVRDGKVIQHQDIADYANFINAFADVRASAAPPQ